MVNCESTTTCSYVKSRKWDLKIPVSDSILKLRLRNSSLGLGLKTGTQKIWVLDLVSKFRLWKFQSWTRSQNWNSTNFILGHGLENQIWSPWSLGVGSPELGNTWFRNMCMLTWRRLRLSSKSVIFCCTQSCCTKKWCRIPALRLRGHSLTPCNASPSAKSKMAVRGPQNGRQGVISNFR